MVQRQVEDIEQRRLLKRMVTDAIHLHGCRKVRDLVDMLQKLDRSITFEEIYDAVNELKHDNKIVLSEPAIRGSFLNYVTNVSSAPFWFTILIAMVTLAAVYLIPQVESWAIIRMVAGGVFVLFVPGYSLLYLLFPTREMDGIGNIALSIAISLAVTPLVGLLLNYSPWGIRLDAMVVSLGIVSIALAFGGTYKSYLERKRVPLTN